MTRLQENLLAVALIALGCIRIASTYREFNGTFDEPAHVAAGLEVLQYHQYTYEYQQPPLPRIASAIGPYLAGLRLPRHRDTAVEGINTLYQDGSEVLYSGGTYWQNLTLARVGLLPFFILLCTITLWWARELFGPVAALWALAFITSLPVLLGHAAFATLDVAGACGALTALYACYRWSRSPSLRTSLTLGASIAFAFVTKFSNVAFVAIGIGSALAWEAWHGRWRPQWRGSAIGVITAIMLMWASYGFSLKTLGAQWGPHPNIDRILEGNPQLRPAIEAAMNTPLPLTEWVLGLRDVQRHNGAGHDSYLFGEFSRFGWWYFFPVVIGVKTPIGLLILATAGIVLLLRFRDRRSWPGLLVVVTLLFLTTSRINSGARHALLVFPLLAIAAGHALSATMARAKLAVIVLASSVFLDSALAHPDYQTYFNPLALGRPERILAESDLDWGQDLDRLARRLKELHAPSVSIRYFGSALLHQSGIPPYRDLDPHQPTTGWVAISAHHFYLEHAKNGAYHWLHRYQPRERIGKSIDLFYIPE